jgi:hypothetical protein
MARDEFDSRAAMRRPKFIGAGVAGVAGAALIACFLPSCVSRIVVESKIHHRSPADVPAHIAHALAGSAGAAFFIALASWLLARSLRLACGLPRRRMTGVRRALLIVQGFVGLCVLCRLLDADASEYFLRLNPHAVVDVCVTGFIGCLLFAYDVPRLLANARRALQARKRLALPFAKLEALPPRGLVHTEGAAAVAVDLSQRASFMLERRGAAAIVDVDPDRVSLIIDSEDEGRSAAETLPAGTAMRIVAEVERAEAADAIYRGALPRLVAPKDRDAGPLRIYVDEAAALKRLWLAAAVEIVGAAGLSLSLLWLVAAIAYIELALPR